jgi:IS4 transposase
MDAFSSIVEFAQITEAREHGQNFLHHLKLNPKSWIVFDKAYTTYKQFSKWSKEKIWFVTREIKNANYHVTKVMLDKTKKHKVKGVMKEQYITVAVKPNGSVVEPLKLRRITYLSEDGKQYIYVTNNFTLAANQIATIYNNRLMIELLFKKIKQKFPTDIFLRRELKCHKNASLLCIDSSIVDGCYKKRGCNENVVC